QLGFDPPCGLAALQVPRAHATLEVGGKDATVDDGWRLARAQPAFALADADRPHPLRLDRRRELDEFGRLGDCLALVAEPAPDRAAAAQRDHAGEQEEILRRRVGAGAGACARHQLPASIAATSPPTSESLSSTMFRCGEPTSIRASARR